MLYSSPLPYQTDADAYFAAIRDLPWAAWLDSGGSGRFDILVAQPVATLVTTGARTEIRDASGVRRSEKDVFLLIRELLGEPITPVPDIPFAGGVLGYWSYDLARRYHVIPEIAQDGEHLPEMAVGIYDWAIILDHFELNARLVSRQRYAETAKILPQIMERIQGAAFFNAKEEKSSFRVDGKIASNFTQTTYRNAFNAVQKYLHEGDCYQVNLAQRYSAQASSRAIFRVSGLAASPDFMRFPGTLSAGATG